MTAAIAPLDAQVAVLGHVEWIEFAPVDHVPVAGEIVHARDPFALPAGGGTVAAVQAARLGARTLFLTAVGGDDVGERTREELGALGLDLHAAWRGGEPQRRGWTHLDAAGERAITVLGPRLVPHGDDLLPWGRLADCAACFITAGDPAAIRFARAARIVLATPRALPDLARADIEVDVLVGSAHDPGEQVDPGALPHPPGFVVRTAGAAGGTWERIDGRSGAWEPAVLPGPVVDSYGCGDSFAGALTAALGAGLAFEDALDLAALAGAHCLTGRGPYGSQLRLGPTR